MLPEITAFLTGTNALSQIAKGLKGANDQLQVQEAVISLQGLILELQSKAFDANLKFEEIESQRTALAEQLAALQNWKTIAEQYQPHELAEGLIVYRLKDGNGGPDIPACPYCFGERRLSPLLKANANQSKLTCHSCKWECLPTKSQPLRTIDRRSGGPEWNVMG